MITLQGFVAQLQVWLLPVLFAITLHEAGHAVVAYAFGDCTAKFQGRLSLNPVRHIDWIGSLLVPGVLLAMGGPLFGWAKPVPIHPNALKPRRLGMAMVALAGPAANMLMAVLWFWLAHVLATGHALFNPQLMLAMCHAGVRINLVLAALNLLPLPPLDGSRILGAMFPSLTPFFRRLEPYGMVLLLLLLTSGLLHVVLNPAMHFLYRIVAWF